MRIGKALLGVLLALLAAWVVVGCGSSSSDTEGRIAFASGTEASSNINIMNGVGGDQTLVTTNGSQPSITRAGDTIAFVRNNNIFTINRNGDNLRQVTTNTSSDVTLCYPAISPSGTRIAYVITPVATGSTSDIHVINANGTGDTTLISNATEPSWSPDGSRILFVRGSDVFVVSATTGQNETNITNNAVGVTVSNPVFLPNGIQIAYIQNATGAASGDIHIRNVNGTGDTVFLSDATALSFRPTGDRVAFVRSGNIFTVNAEGTDLKQLTTTGDASSPSWSL